MGAVAIVFAWALPLLSSAATGEAPTSVSPPTPEASRAMFERFKGLAGTWDGKSTKDWEETLRYEVIAGGSTVLETSVNAHPDQTMATAFHMDGDRLMLTHYCMAKNQPRLVATGFADGGRTVVFTFKDGGKDARAERAAPGAQGAVLGGYFVIGAKDYEAALAIARSSASEARGHDRGARDRGDLTGGGGGASPTGRVSLISGSLVLRSSG